MDQQPQNPQESTPTRHLIHSVDSSDKNIVSSYEEISPEDNQPLPPISPVSVPQPQPQLNFPTVPNPPISSNIEDEEQEGQSSSDPTTSQQYSAREESRQTDNGKRMLKRKNSKNPPKQQFDNRSEIVMTDQMDEQLSVKRPYSQLILDKECDPPEEHDRFKKRPSNRTRSKSKSRSSAKWVRDAAVSSVMGLVAYGAAWYFSQKKRYGVLAATTTFGLMLSVMRDMD